MVDIVFAKIGEVTSEGATLILPGESVATTKKYNYISSYTPTAGDRTAVLKYGGTMLIIGKLAI